MESLGINKFEKKIEKVVLVGISVLCVVYFLSAMDIFPSRFEMNIRHISYEGTIDSVFYKDLHHYVIVKNETARTKICLPEKSDFHLINEKQYGMMIKKLWGSYKVKLYRPQEDSAFMTLKYPNRTLFYSLPIEEYRGVSL